MIRFSIVNLELNPLKTSVAVFFLNKATILLINGKKKFSGDFPVVRRKKSNDEPILKHVKGTLLIIDQVLLKSMSQFDTCANLRGIFWQKKTKYKFHMIKDKILSYYRTNNLIAILGRERF